MPLPQTARWPRASRGKDDVELVPESFLQSVRYALCRDRYRDEMIALKRERRVALGPHATITFECQATVRFQIQEVIWIEGRSGIEAVAREIETYACLLPSAGALCASLMIHGGSSAFGSVALVSGDRVAAGVELAPGDPGDPVRYLGFVVDDALMLRLDRGEPAHVRVTWTHGEVATPLPRALLRTLTREAMGEPGPALDPTSCTSFSRGDAPSPTSRSSNPVSENHHVRSGGPESP